MLEKVYFSDFLGKRLVHNTFYNIYKRKLLYISGDWKMFLKDYLSALMRRFYEKLRFIKNIVIFTNVKYYIYSGIRIS